MSLLNGEVPNGTWKLEVVDAVPGQTGTLTGWSLHLIGQGTSAAKISTTAQYIPDAAAGLVSSLSFSGLSGEIADLNLRLAITHPNTADLRASLIGPSGTAVLLFNRVGGSGDNFTNTRLDDSASTPISQGSAPFSDVFRPAEPLRPIFSLTTGHTHI